MKKGIYLFLALIIVACSSDDSSSSSDNDSSDVDPIIGIWTLSNEEWIGEGDWPLKMNLRC